ncbi:MAG: hypothetical protein UW52_C0037G0009 [Candidatus Gottesmanbacteria bacterium GW2011_GWA1_44_24b]|uniref:Uncharacterized protein n=2 Tax=Candidatus Gottesmaniibacteriota TaxID=1752720 RepID=A0A0G1IJL7_9BACT|nr:MAG: hypothetical protein UW52_C0037G0009 [Candidatus Gottesmanbacteria bacterium GW2011_GWA1_44_24b]HCM82031.1 hypothetical protein [Patescibacteria group bacterium]
MPEIFEAIKGLFAPKKPDPEQDDDNTPAYPDIRYRDTKESLRSRLPRGILEELNTPSEIYPGGKQAKKAKIAQLLEEFPDALEELNTYTQELEKEEHIYWKYGK